MGSQDYTLILFKQKCYSYYVKSSSSKKDYYEKTNLQSSARLEERYTIRCHDGMVLNGHLATYVIVQVQYNYLVINVFTENSKVGQRTP